MNGIVIHIPHSSDYVPEFFYPCFFDIDKIKEELNVMTDWYTDDLFDIGFCHNVQYVKHRYSRIICDPERFLNPVDEQMMAKGMGMYYTHSHKNQKMKRNPFESLEGLSYYSVALQMYKKHQELFFNTVKSALFTFKDVIIVDAHSFSDSPLPYEDDQTTKRPDICIGTDNFYSSATFRDFVYNYFVSKGLSVAFDFPYQGTVVPLPYVNDKNPSLHSVMIEVNKKLYLNGLTNQKNNNYGYVKAILVDLFVLLKDFKF